MPHVTLRLIVPGRPVPPKPHSRPSLTRAVGPVSVPSLGLAPGDVGFEAITSFIGSGSQHDLSTAFIVGRLVFGHLPDRIGRRRASVSLRAGRSGCTGFDLARALVRVGSIRRDAHRLRLLVRLPRLRRTIGSLLTEGKSCLAAGAYTALLDLDWNWSGTGRLGHRVLRQRCSRCTAAAIASRF